jgi:hypothetical protein
MPGKQTHGSSSGWGAHRRTVTRPFNDRAITQKPDNSDEKKSEAQESASVVAALA